MKSLLQILLIFITWLATIAHATPPTQQLSLPTYSISFSTTENQKLESEVKIGIEHFARSAIEENLYSQKSISWESYTLGYTLGEGENKVLNAAENSLKPVDDRLSFIVQRLRQRQIYTNAYTDYTAGQVTYSALRDSAIVKAIKGFSALKGGLGKAISKLGDDIGKEAGKAKVDEALRKSGVLQGAGNFTEYIKNGFKINASTLDDAFKHVDDFVPNGAGKPTFNSNNGLVGCHNEVKFNNLLSNNGGRIEIVSSTPKGVNGVKDIQYKVLQLDVQGNPIPGQYYANGSTFTKTVYDPTIFPEASMKELGYKAFKDAIDNPTTKIDVNGVQRTFEGTANGRTISGYYKDVNGEKIISTWWIKN
jgi:hypothetical protein